MEYCEKEEKRESNYSKNVNIGYAIDFPFAYKYEVSFRSATPQHLLRLELSERFTSPSHEVTFRRMGFITCEPISAILERIFMRKS